MRKVNDFDLVVCSKRDDATVWRVVSSGGFRVKIIDALLTYCFPNVAPQVIDISMLRKPTAAQLAKFKREGDFLNFKDFDEAMTQ